MIKRTLLTSVFLFVPLVASWAEDTLVIGSEQSLTEKNLPLVYDVMDNVYRDTVLDRGCHNTKSIFEEFVNGKITVPFSAKELLDLCKKVSYTDFDGGLGECRRKHCPHFVLRYIQDIAEYQKTPMIVSDDVPFDEEKFEVILFEKYGYCDFTGFKRTIKTIKLSGRERFSISELLDICRVSDLKCPSEEVCVDIIYDYKEMLSGKIVIK